MPDSCVGHLGLLGFIESTCLLSIFFAPSVPSLTLWSSPAIAVAQVCKSRTLLLKGVNIQYQSASMSLSSTQVRLRSAWALQGSCCMHLVKTDILDSPLRGRILCIDVDWVIGWCSSREDYRNVVGSPVSYSLWSDSGIWGEMRVKCASVGRGSWRVRRKLLYTPMKTNIRWSIKGKDIVHWCWLSHRI